MRIQSFMAASASPSMRAGTLLDQVEKTSGGWSGADPSTSASTSSNSARACESSGTDYHFSPLFSPQLASSIGESTAGSTTSSISETIRDGLNNAMPQRVKRLIERHRTKKASKSISGLLRLMRDAEQESESALLYQSTLVTSICAWVESCGADSTVCRTVSNVSEVAECLWTVQKESRETYREIRAKLEILAETEKVKSVMGQRAVAAQTAYHEAVRKQHDTGRLYELDREWRVLKKQAKLDLENFKEQAGSTIYECLTLLLMRLSDLHQQKCKAIQQCLDVVKDPSNSQQQQQKEQQQQQQHQMVNTESDIRPISQSSVSVYAEDGSKWGVH